MKTVAAAHTAVALAAVGIALLVLALAGSALAGTDQPHLQPPTYDGHGHVTAVAKMPPSQAGTAQLYAPGNRLLASSSVEFGGKIILTADCVPGGSETYEDVLWFEADGTDSIHHSVDLPCVG